VTKILSITVVFFVYSTFATVLDITQVERKKIEFLKAELIASQCKFERNGISYTPEKTIKHINKKHHHFKKDIDTATKFIELAASKSTMSGQPYFMLCKGVDRIESSVWLNNKLGEFHDIK